MGHLEMNCETGYIWGDICPPQITSCGDDALVINHEMFHCLNNNTVRSHTVCPEPSCYLLLSLVSLFPYSFFLLDCFFWLNFPALTCVSAITSWTASIPDQTTVLVSLFALFGFCVFVVVVAFFSSIFLIVFLLDSLLKRQSWTTINKEVFPSPSLLTPPQPSSQPSPLTTLNPENDNKTREKEKVTNKIMRLIFSTHSSFTPQQERCKPNFCLFLVIFHTLTKRAWFVIFAVRKWTMKNAKSRDQNKQKNKRKNVTNKTIKTDLNHFSSFSSRSLKVSWITRLHTLTTSPAQIIRTDLNFSFLWSQTILCNLSLLESSPVSHTFFEQTHKLLQNLKFLLISTNLPLLQQLKTSNNKKKAKVKSQLLTFAEWSFEVLYFVYQKSEFQVCSYKTNTSTTWDPKQVLPVQKMSRFCFFFFWWWFAFVVFVCHVCVTALFLWVNVSNTFVVKNWPLILRNFEFCLKILLDLQKC